MPFDSSLKPAGVCLFPQASERALFSSLKPYLDSLLLNELEQTEVCPLAVKYTKALFFHLHTSQLYASKSLSMQCAP